MRCQGLWPQAGWAGPRGRLLAGAHPFVDGVRLAQCSLSSWDAIGDAPIALAQTPQFTADLLQNGGDASGPSSPTAMPWGTQYPPGSQQFPFRIMA